MLQLFSEWEELAYLSVRAAMPKHPNAERIFDRIAEAPAFGSWLSAF